MLSIEELKELEKEFVEYLILNGIEADDWKSLKKDNPLDAEKVIELFSDVVFENIMRKTRFLEWRSAKELKSLQCLDGKFIVIGLNLSKVDKADLTNNEYLKNALNSPPSNIEVYTTELKYDQKRELEIFNLIEKGFVISDGSLFKTLCLTLPQ